MPDTVDATRGSDCRGRPAASNCSPQRKRCSSPTATTRPRWTTSPSAAGVSKPVLYQHFPGKLDLYLALIDDAGRRRSPARSSRRWPAPTTTSERVHGVLTAYFDFVDGDGTQRPGAFRLIFETDLGNEPAVRERVERGDATRSCARWPTRWPATPDWIRAQAELLAMTLTGAAQVAARWWLDNDRPVPHADAVRLLESLLWRGISNFPRQGRREMPEA